MLSYPTRARVATEAMLARPARVGLGTAAGITITVLLAQALQGRAPFGPDGLAGFYSALVHIPIVSFLPAAYLVVVRGARQRLDRIRSLTPTRGAPVAMALPPLGSITAPWLVAGAAGLLLGVIGPYLTEPDKGTLFSY